MDILSNSPKEISCKISKYMRQPYLDNIDLHTIVLHKRCVGCNKLIIRNSDVKNISFKCQNCNRLLCKQCVFFGIPPQEPIDHKQKCGHHGLKLI